MQIRCLLHPSSAFSLSLLRTHTHTHTLCCEKCWLWKEQFDEENFNWYGSISHTPAGSLWAVTQAKWNQMHCCLFSQLYAQQCDVMWSFWTKSWNTWLCLRGRLHGLNGPMTCTTVFVLYSVVSFAVLTLSSYYFVYTAVCACFWSLRSNMLFSGSFRQSQPSLQSSSCNRDLRSEWQCTWAGQAVQHSHVWLLLHRTGQYVFKLLEVFISIPVYIKCSF